MTRTHDGVERPTPHGGTEKPDKITIAACLLALLFCIAVAACLIAMVAYYTADTHYSVAIDSASALDPKMGVSFNLTLGVASRSHSAYACIDPSMIVEVFYRGVRVAAGDAAGTPQTCARPRNVAELPVVARATRMLAGGVLDNLAAEMRRGAAVFDLRLRNPDGTRYHGGKSWTAWWVLDCKGSRVGDAAVPCDSLTYTEVLN
ncbi:unnamed protein product [Alopecurus aequalis]